MQAEVMRRTIEVLPSPNRVAARVAYLSRVLPHVALRDARLGTKVKVRGRQCRNSQYKIIN